MTPLDTVKKNLAALEGESAVLSEKILYELSELSAIVYEKIEGDLQGDEAESLFHSSKAEDFLFSALEHPDTPQEYFPLLREKRLLSFASQLAAFSVFLAEKFGDALPFREETKRRARIAYVPSGRADSAYMALAGKRRDAAVSYAENAVDAIAALLSHKADFAMLPYMLTQGGELSGIQKLWRENDLYIAALISVPSGEERLIYALLSDTLSPYVVSSDMQCFFEITADSFAHMGRILSSFSFFDYKTASLRTESEEYGRVRARVSLLGEGNAFALWIFLSLYSVGFSFLGRCPLIET